MPKYNEIKYLEMATSKVFTTSVLEGHSRHGFGFGLLPASGTVNLPTHIARGWKSTMEKKEIRPPNLSMIGNSISRRTPSVAELRMSLLVALASQAASQSQRILQDLASETLKYVNPRRFDARNLEEALMAVPDLETIPYRVLRREKDYEIRQVESYYVAETTMPGKTGFDFYGSSQGFNVLAAYLFGKNTKREEMAMTTPVFVQKTQPDGEKMEMTTPVITKQAQDQEKWQMSFVMPSKYGADLPLPNDPSVRLKRVQEKTVAVAAFSGFVTDEEVRHRESKLRAAISKDPQVRVKENASIEVAQYNPPFTPPFMRRNEVSLEVEWAQDNIE